MTERLMELEKLVLPAKHALEHVPQTESLVIGGIIGQLIMQIIEKDATIERLTAENAIKSEAIKKYENDAEYWYQETEKARSMFLGAHDESVRLRKALEEARDTLEIGKYGAYEKSISILNSSLGEGDKHELSVLKGN